MGGSNMLLEMKGDKRYSYRWQIDSAYIMSDIPKIDDIGIVELSNSVFFDKRALINPEELHTARIVPICLGGLRTDIKNKEVRGVGWGTVYEEAPMSNPRDPILSSCMTNQASPDPWKFQSCDIRRMKKGNTWECDKIRPPPTYDPGQDSTCKELFEDAKKVRDKKDPGKTISEKINKIDNLYIVKQFTDKKSLECVNPHIITKFGWCYLKDFPEKYEQPNWDPDREAWGICSPSCDPELMQV